jgi:hypothetical protein
LHSPPFEVPRFDSANLLLSSVCVYSGACSVLMEGGLLYRLVYPSIPLSLPFPFQERARFSIHSSESPRLRSTFAPMFFRKPGEDSSSTSEASSEHTEDEETSAPLQDSVLSRFQNLESTASEQPTDRQRPPRLDIRQSSTQNSAT